MHPSRVPILRSMCSWLDAHKEGHEYMEPIRDLMHRALDGRPIDVSRTDWADLIPAHIAASGNLAGCMSRHFPQWREIAPDRADVWRMLRNGWADPKIDEDYPYAATSATRPPPSPSQDAVQKEYPKMLEMGVIARVENPPMIPLTSNQFHVIRNVPMEKKDEHGVVLAEVRVVTSTKTESTNEEVPKFQGFSPDDYCRWTRPGRVSLKGDLSKMFWQVRAKQAQSNLMMFYWGDTLYQWKVMVMGMAGSGYWATSLTNIVRSFLRTRFLIDIFTYVDEWIQQDQITLMAYLNQVFTVTVLVWLGARPNIGKTQLAFTLDRVPTVSLFIGIMADSMLNRVSPAPARGTAIRQQAANMRRAVRHQTPVRWSELRQLKARIISCSRLHMMAGFLTVKMATVHRCFLSKHGSSERAHAKPMPTSILEYIRRELDYWAVMPEHEAWRPAVYPAPTGTVVVDASTYRLAMHGRSPNLQDFFTSIPLTPEERETSHNSMEMLSITKGVPVLVRDGFMTAGTPTMPKALVSLADNVTTVQALNKLTTASLFIAQQMVHFIRWQATNHFWVSGYYHPKSLMDTQRAIRGLGAGMTTDEASRTFGGLWARAISARWFNLICSHFGIQQTRVIDMMACCQSRRVPRFVSQLPDIRNLWTDALNPLYPWKHEDNEHIAETDILYCFPSPKMLDRIIDRMEHSSNYVLLVTRYDSRLPVRLRQSLQGYPPMIFGLELDEMEAPEGPAAPSLSGDRMTLLASLFCPPSSSRPEETLRPSGRLSALSGHQSPAQLSLESISSPAFRLGSIGSQAKATVYSTFPARP